MNPRAQVVTDPRADDSRLRGGTFAIQFHEVWSTALILARTLRGWSVTGTDARNGEITAEVEGWIWKRPDQVTVRISLDDMGLTRVDLAAAPLTRRISRRVSTRRMGRFMRSLVAALQSGG